MSNKSNQLVTTLMDACYLDGGCWGEPKAVALAQEKLEAYIAALHTRITCLHTANNNQAEMLGRQAQLVARWRNRAIALGHTTPIVDDRSGVQVGTTVHRFSGGPSSVQNLPRVQPDPEVDVGPGSSPVPDTYQGHAGTTGGLQQHSVGELYPFIIVMHGDRWHVDHASLGRVTRVGYEQQHDACAYARFLKEQDKYA